MVKSEKSAKPEKAAKPAKSDKPGKPGRARKGSPLAHLQASARLSRTALAARLLAHGFYAGQDQIMLALAVEDVLTPGQLAQQLGVRPPTITKTINRLQSQGFLSKSASAADARQAHITLTATGRDAIKSIEKSIRKTEKQALKGLDKKEQRALIKLLQKIEDNLSGIADEIPDEALEHSEDRVLQLVEND